MQTHHLLRAPLAAPLAALLLAATLLLLATALLLLGAPPRLAQAGGAAPAPGAPAALGRVRSSQSGLLHVADASALATPAPGRLVY